MIIILIYQENACGGCFAQCLVYEKHFKKKKKKKPTEDFPGGAVVETPSFQCGGLGSIPGQDMSHSTVKR